LELKNQETEEYLVMISERNPKAITGSEDTVENSTERYFREHINGLLALKDIRDRFCHISDALRIQRR
jgi:hypothetical protein